jgi:uncharacterized protein involved in exopolysaccharide biosynthesis
VNTDAMRDVDDGAVLRMVVEALLGARRVVLFLIFLPAVLTLTTALLLPRNWTSASSFIPQSRRTNGDISGFAAQFGVALPGQDATQSPAFYAQLVTGRELLGALVDSNFIVLGDTIRLNSALRIRDRDPRILRERTIRELGNRISAVTVPKSGVVRLSVRAPSPELALQLNRRMLDLVNRFNLENRRSQAGAERRFVEKRMVEARAESRVAEDRLQDFLRRNRDFRNSPDLAFQQERLARDATLKQQVYAQLAQSYEQSRIEEVRDTPVITVVEQPERPALPDSRGIVTKSILAAILGFAVALFFALYKAGGTHSEPRRAT